MRSKGFCFIEFEEPDAAKQALQTMNGFELGGRKLKVGPPTNGGNAAAMTPMMPTINPLLAGINPQLAMLQAQQMQRASAPVVPQAPVKKTRIYVGSIFFNLTSDHVQRVFEAFGKVRSCQLIPNPDTGLHKGYGFIDFEEEKSAVEAIENMNGFELCGRPLKVGWAAHSQQAAAAGAAAAPLPIPNPAIALALSSVAQGGAVANAASVQQASKCIRLSNMIDPSDNDDAGLCDEVKEECEEIAPVVQVVVKGNYVFVNFKDVQGGKNGFVKLHGRWFGGKKIEAQYYDGAKADAGIFDI